MGELSNYRITDNDVAQHGVIAAPDRLIGTAAQNKAVFDRLIRDAVKEKYNAMLAAVEGELNAASVWEPYDAEKEYVPGNKVIYNGSSYLCTEACTGVLPTDAAYWRLIAAHGKDGTGAGDMCMDVYDPRGVEADVFAYVDERTDTYSREETLSAETAQEFVATGLVKSPPVTPDEAFSALVGASDGLASNVTYYVDAAAGDDANDGLSAEAPFKTIMAAVKKIPKALNGFTATINLASGSYVEYLLLQGFVGGAIQINGPDATLARVAAVRSSISATIICKAITYHAALGASYPLIQSSDGVCLSLQGNNILLQNNNAQPGIALYSGAIIYVNSVTLTIRNCASAIYVNSSSTFVTYLGSINIQSCTLGINAYGSGVARLYAEPSVINTPTKYYTAMGGRIYAGGQTSVPRY